MESHLGNPMIIGISACLLGESVRYDAGHKCQPRLIATLSPHATLRPFCPEVEAGLGVPRPPVELIETSRGRVRALGVEEPSTDVSEALLATAERFCTDELEGLSGFVFKSRSPSCGLGSTPVNDPEGQRLRYGDGLFAQAIRQARPWLPCVEESWLNRPDRYYAFLSACAVVAHHEYGATRYGKLVARLEREVPTDDSEPWPALIAAIRSAVSNEEAALEERLVDWWHQS